MAKFLRGAALFAGYAAGLFLLSPNLISRFSTHFYADAGDGLQNAWNMWWVGKAVTELHTLPWHTPYLHFPFGVTLLGQTLNPFNGLVGIVLEHVCGLSLLQSFNAMVVFGFAMGGVTAYLLARELTGDAVASVVGGAIFTFSEFHFAHASGHLQLVSLEWMPLFVLIWIKWMRATRPSARLAFGAAAVLFLVLLCDFYYFFYSVLLAAAIASREAWVRRDVCHPLRLKKPLEVACFAVPAMLSSGLLVLALMWANHVDPMIGGHSSTEFSMDLLAPFVPGGHWRFAQWTRPVWSTWTGNIEESSVYVGASALLLLVYAVFHARELPLRMKGLWAGVLVTFAVLSLGPSLHWMGAEVHWGPKWHALRRDFYLPVLPYIVVQNIPLLPLSGVPVRMMVVAQLAAAMFGAAALADIRRRARKSNARRLAVVAVAGLVIVDVLPAPIPVTSPNVPGYVSFLRQRRAAGVNDAVYDAASPSYLALYYQTVHEIPMAYGYVSRTPTSVWRLDEELKRDFDAGGYPKLKRTYGFTYLVLPKDATRHPVDEDLVFMDDQARVYLLR
jgi:hypothetical protein